MNEKISLITGASSGIGEAAAVQLKNRGSPYMPQPEESKE